MHPSVAKAPQAAQFFEGFEERYFETSAGPIFCRIGGEGPPLVLLHGYPQTSAMWHAVAASLAQDYRVICPDLRGYGRSAKPETDASHTPYSKRAMAGDVIAIMDALGHERFLVGAHDRGGRVAHRLAADHPDRVVALSTLDIAPTREMYREGTSAFAHTYWHWYWLTLPHPFPERLIGADPVYFWLHKCGAGSAGLTPFVRQALDEYLTAFSDPAAIHGACEDYRAAATIDIAHDDADSSKLTMPLLALWGRDGAIEAHFDCLALWRERAEDVQGWALPGGHYVAEECPDEVIAAWRPFFAKAAANL
ncbi:alpha/beta hydrolase [Cognatiyoonia sp. IB215182]|uniref:alpha/beta fold hydrolase n=1 Tax=Cognatiyoonia sp. IB215182 TaxID=3097353 RepID=UPI002A0CA1E2|nr:alpha/beta hydrolase [Cognatiyoonia sp. IB215182]MDX8352629.1 alpha/beta hydrolase [Cognatiyoonia sp. IB215182]